MMLYICYVNNDKQTHNDMNNTRPTTLYGYSLEHLLRGISLNVSSSKIARISDKLDRTRQAVTVTIAGEVWSVDYNLWGSNCGGGKFKAVKKIAA